MIRPTSTSFSYHPELDGLRALAMVAIVFFHADAQGWANGFIALDLFFVLSGFLVAHVVLAEVEESGTLLISRFYARRVRRLLPAALVAVVGTCVLWLLTAPQPERLELVRHAQAALVWLANWQFIAEARDYFAGDIQESPFLHYWSLSIEEQYYVVFPLIVLAWIRFAPTRRTVLMGALAVGFVLSLVSQVVTAQVDPSRAYFATDARVFQLLGGALLAVAVREYARSGDGPGGADWPRLGPLLGTAGAAAYLLLGTELIPMSHSARNIVATFVAGAMIVGLYAAPSARLTRLLSRPTPVYLGKITYGTYLWHWPVTLLLAAYLTVRPSVVAVMTLALATAVACMSYELMEKPIRRAQWIHPFRWPVVASGLAASLLAAGFVIHPVMSSERTPSVVLVDSVGERVDRLTDNRATADRLDQQVPELDLTAAREARGPKRSCTPESPEECVVVEGDGLHVLLVGDSHAQTWGEAFATIAREHDLTFSMSVSAGCPFQQGVTVTHDGDGTRPECEDARSGFYTDTLPALEPDVVVFAAAAQADPEWHGVVSDASGDTGEPRQTLSRGTKRTVRTVTDAGASVLFLKTAMGTDGWGTAGHDPLECLSTANRLRDCAVTQPSDRPAEDAIYEALAIDDDRVDVIDPTPIYCPDAPVCLPVLQEQSVWRNEDHLNADLLAELHPRLWRMVRATQAWTARG